MTLYRQFGGKDALVAATLEQWSTLWLHRLADAMDRRGDDPPTASTASGTSSRPGSWRTASAARSWPTPPPSSAASPTTAHAKIVQHRQALRQLLEDLAKAAGADAAVLAAQLQVLLDGAISAAAVDHDPAAATGARTLARAAIATASSSA